MKPTDRSQDIDETPVRPFPLSVILFLVVATINITATVCSLLWA